MFLLFPYSFLQAGIVLMCPQKATHPSSFPLLYFSYFTLTSWLWFFLFPACKFEHILSPLHAFSKCFRWGFKLENNMGKNLFRQQKYWKRRKKYYKILLFFFFFLTAYYQVAFHTSLLWAVRKKQENCSMKLLQTWPGLIPGEKA